MKQTNNAIKFLMAQYRAIFKNAYFKGMATALVLTAGLAAGQAQAAASNAYVFSGTGTEWNQLPNGQVAGPAGEITNNKYVAGALAGENIAFDEDGNISTADRAEINASNTATGGKLVISDSTDTADTYNFVSISGSAWGGTAEGNGNVTAEHNDVFVRASGYVAKSGSSYGDIIGGRAISKQGVATANNNDITVEKLSNASKGAAEGNLIGGMARGATGALALNNTITETGTSSADSNLVVISSHRVGGWAQASGSTGGTFKAEGNILDYENVKVSGSNAIQIIGGMAETLTGAKGDYFQAFNNTVSFEDSKLIGDSGKSVSVLVMGNYINNTDTTSTLSSVQGTEGKPSVHILNSSITYGGVLGGRISASGSATAQNNSVKLENTDVISGTGIMGASIESTLAANATATFNVTGNTVTISNSDTKAASAKTVESGIQAASIKVSGVSGYNDLLNKVTINASNNSIEIGPNINLTGDGSIYGVLAHLNGNSGSNVTLSNNSVTFNGTIKNATVSAGSGNIWGVYTNELGATATNNTVTVNGSITNGLVVGAQVANLATTINVDEVSTLTGNKIVIGADAAITNTNLRAVSLVGSTGVVTGNSVEINGDVRNSTLITGGAGADSVVTLAQGAELTSSTTPTTILSDVIDVDGKLTVSNDQDVTFAGYYHNGEDAAAGSAEYNPNQTTISSSASILNGGTINVYGTTSVDDNAKLHATSAASEIVVDGSKVNSEYKAENHDIKVDFVNKNNGTLVISAEKLKSYLTKGDQYQATADAAAVEDVAGKAVVTSGGTIDFKDSVVLSDFDFTTGTATGGQIKVDPNMSGGSGSFFKADTVTVAHKLAQNATTADGDYKQLTALKPTAGVGIIANTLNLGAADLSSTRSAAIIFGQATVKEEINFIARTSGKDIADDAAGTELDTFNDGYHLTSQVIGSNFMLTNDQDAKQEYYTSLAGNINGDVTVEGTSGEIWIQDGDWTANDLVTVTSGGSIVVGNNDSSGSAAEGITGYDDRLPDATLSLSAGLVLDVTKGGDAATVTAEGKYPRVYERPDDFYGDNRYVELDLTNGVEMKTDNGTITGKAEINATNGGVILLNASDVNDMLAQNHAWNKQTGTNNNQSGAFFKASLGGELRVDGDITAQFSDFDSDPNTNGFNLSGSGSKGPDPDNPNVIDADYSGRLVANSLTIENPHNENLGENGVIADTEYLSNHQADIHLGGAVIVDDLEINDLQRTTVGKNDPQKPNNYASSVTIADGGALISHSLSSVNNKLILGDGTDSAILYFETDAVADTGSISVNQIELASGSEIDFANGDWDAPNTDFILSGAGSSLIVGDDYDYDVNENPYSATLKAGDLTMGDGTYLYVAANGTASFNGANLEELSAPTADNDKAGILVEGYLTINGTAISDTNKNGGVTFGEEGSIRIANNGTLNFENAAVTGAIIAGGAHTGDTVTLKDGYTKIDNQGGTLRLGFASGTSFTSAAVQDLKSKLFTAGSFNNDDVLKNGGLLNLGSATFGKFTGYTAVNDPERGLSGWTASWDDVKQDSDLINEIEDVTTDQMSQSNITGIELSDEVKGAWGSFSMNSTVPASSGKVTLAGNTSLSYAEGNNGLFISDSKHEIALGAVVGSQKFFTLNNGGEIGTVTLTNGKDDVDSNLTTLNINGNGNLTTIHGINAIASNNGTGTYDTLVNVNSDTDVIANIDAVGTVAVNNGATLHVYNPDAASKDVIEVNVNDLEVTNSTVKIDGDLNIDGIGNGGEGEAFAIGGSITATNIDLDNGAGLSTVNGGLITAETIEATDAVRGDSQSFIAVGYDLDAETWDDTEETHLTGTGYLEVTKYLDLNGGTLMVDPAYSEATSVAAVMNFKDGSDRTWEETNDVGIVNGRALIGKNAALGIGATLAETRAVIADFQENGSLSQEKYGSILYLNGQLTIANGSEIALNADPVTADVDGIRRALKYTITSNQLDQFATLGLGANTAILMSEAAFEDADGKKTQTAIHFDRESAVINANGGEIVLIGAFDASEKLNFFSDKDSGNNNGVDIVNASGADGTIKVYTQNGFLFAELRGKNQGQDVQLHVDPDTAFSVMNQASYPVVETLISYHEDRIVKDTTTTPETPAPETDEENQSGSSIPAEKILTQSELTSRTSEQETRETIPAVPIVPQEPNTPEANTRVTGSSDFLNEVVTKSHGAPAEAAARLAIYGGAVQAAMAATSSTTDAIAARMGVGDTAAITMANNGQGAALWLAPVYKTHDSDSFDSQGLDYGVDLNLYGVALGADFEFVPGLTAGIMFNVGSGDADGQGNAAANNTSNDFDYWGAALYGNYTYDALSVTADVSYTAVDNDLEATTGMQQYSKLESSTDTTAISLGVTAKYTFDFGGVEVAPHAGLRYTNIDLDDYSIKSNGETIADYSADKVNIFSIPVGVTFAKEFTGDAWTVKPSLDLTLTGNFGDDDISGDVSWTGVDGLVTPVSSEYMDDFTYGATLGIEAASTGGFSLGLGVNYTGSSNVDEFGVNANARFVF